ncbi:MAG: neutral zinc metallopeptidase, partial [Gallionellaceae bacterium]|nr:neutral zinc metallopeptidase [Gallionellaceae bacterium]
MRFGQGRESSNVEDRRGGGSIGGRSIGIGTLVIALVAMYFGVDPSVVLNGLAPEQPAAVRQAAPPADDEMARFVSMVLADTEDT